MTALFNFQSLLFVILLLVCSCTYVRSVMPTVIDRNKQGFFGVFWMFARIGERLSPYVALACVAMATELSPLRSRYSGGDSTAQKTNYNGVTCFWKGDEDVAAVEGLKMITIA